MILRSLLAAIIFAVVAAAGRAEASAADADGCYGVELGAWKPVPDAVNSSFWQMPRLIRLTRAAGRVRGHRLILPISSDQRWQGRRGFWRLAGDRLEVTWGDGFAFIRAELRSDEGIWVGTAMTFADGEPAVHRSTRLVLRPVACPPDH